MQIINSDIKSMKDVSSFQDTYSRIYKCRELSVKNITFCVTYDCTLNCSYCYQPFKNHTSMTKETGEKAIDRLFMEYDKNDGYITHANSKAVILEFIGGEPLMEIELIDYLTEYFKYKAILLNHRWAIHYMISITTNGTLYDNPKVKSYLEKNRGRVSLKITIDGDKQLHNSCRCFPNGDGSYDIVEKAFISHMNAFGDKDTKLTLAPDNVDYLFPAMINLYNIGCRKIFANCVYEEGWTVDHAKLLYKGMKDLSDWLLQDEKYNKLSNSLFLDDIGNPKDSNDNQNWCGGTGKMLAFSPEGDIYPCLRYLPFCIGENVKPLVIGNVDSGIGCTIEQKNTIDMLNNITRRSQSTDECFNCPIASGCAWCSAYNYEKTGTPDKRVTYICVMHKARVLANCYYWNKLYRQLDMPDRFPMNVPKEWALEIISEDEYNTLVELSK